MARDNFFPQRPTRRSLLKSLGAAPLVFRAAPLWGAAPFPSVALSPPLSFEDSRFAPAYPAKSPLDDVLRRVRPGSDEFALEGDAYAIALVLSQWSRLLRAGDVRGLRQFLDPGVQFASFAPAGEVKLRSGGPIETFRRTFRPELTAGPDQLLADLERWIGPTLRIETAEFEMTAISALPDEHRARETQVRYSIAASRDHATREQRVGAWRIHWVGDASSAGAEVWTVRQWSTEAEERSVVRGGGFVDVTARALGALPSYRDQVLLGADEWRTVLDGASGIDVYGNNGVAAGDYDNDGFDDLYISQPAGLPNRLYRNRGDGTFEDVTEKAGVGVLDNTACALFADFRNIGLQDLLVVCGTGPILFLNRGDGTFAKKADAFQFARPPEGTFTHAAIADYDRDGHLDVYFCVYSYYLGLDQYHYPAPYFDARNGPPNFLFHNNGDATFVDRTQAAGLNAENDRYSFACAWGEVEANGRPGLYVVNDFGRNNLYRNNGDGTFRAVSEQAHVQDAGAGMSAAWGDFNNDGRPDLYVANMWSAAGQRVSQQGAFHASASAAVRSFYQDHADGNGLYRNQGDGTFQSAGKRAGAQMGRWAWCSDFLDFDHDGYADLYVTNGYITAPGQQPGQDRQPLPEGGGDAQGAQGIDLGSFFWRQVVAKSPDDATPSLAYERGWNALNELIRTDSSWSGSERNVLLANNRDGSFSEISGAVGLDCIEDSRSFALADIDHDGRLEIILKNRNAPQLRILRNAMQGIGDSVCFRLRGTKSNRDAIGASVTLVAGDLKQTKYLQAGSGFLAQHSKELFFGLGAVPGKVSATVRWPSGLVQLFDGVPRNSRISLEEGTAILKADPFGAPPSAYSQAAPVRTAPASKVAHAPAETWLLDPLKAPAFSLPDLAGRLQSLESMRGRATLLTLWSAGSHDCLEQLTLLQRSRPTILAADCHLLALNIDPEEGASNARRIAQAGGFFFPVLFATADVAGVYNIIFRYLFDRRCNLALPTTFLLDANGDIVKVYQGPFEAPHLLADARSIPGTRAERIAKGLPFAGTLHDAAFTRNDFTYGVAMFQHGYLDQAAESFQQVIAARPNEAEGYYNLGTLSLRRNDFAAARQYLQQTLKLKPNYPEAWNNLGMLAAQQGQSAEAIESFRRSLALRPAYATALLNLGNVYRRQKNYAEAQESLTRALALQPDDPEANYSLGMLYAQQGQLQPASQYLQKAVALRPDYAEALNNLGVLAVREQNYTKAEQQFRSCMAQNPNFEDAYVNLARLYVLQHDKAKARTTLQDLLRQKPDSAIAKQGLQALDAMP